MIKNILAINFNHDGSGALLCDGKLTAYVNTERFSRKKKHPGIREEELSELLEQSNLDIEDIHFIMLCNLNNMDSQDIVSTYGNDLKNTFLNFELSDNLKFAKIRGVEIPCMVNPPHYLLHCALSYYTSPFSSAISFAIDPTGCDAYFGADNSIHKLDHGVQFRSSIGYTQVAEMMFGTGIFGAGKVMGLAPYGTPPDASQVDYEKLKSFKELKDLASENTIHYKEKEIELNASLAFHIQRALELELTRGLHRLFELCLDNKVEPNLCLSGGTALNSVANQIAFENSNFERIHLHPASGDDGTSIGAALWFWHDNLGNPKRIYSNAELMYSTKTYGDDLVLEILDQYKNEINIRVTSDYISETADLIAEGNIVGWFQGGSEIGPRALGNRSILADPRNPAMKDILNEKVKFRESFRPFAPAVLNEHAEKWFGIKDSPFMLRVANVLIDKIPAVTHVDGTARIQTVSREDNESYFDLIHSFYELTGVPTIIDTSFNVQGEPIVEHPTEAINCFLNSKMDALVFKNIIATKL